MKSLEKLMLTVGLLDRITGPMRGIQRTIDQVTSHSRKAFMNTAAGVTALIAASTSFATTINPANDMNNALGEVRSLEVADDTLAALNQAGLKYSIQFGEQASSYVRSAYDIQSAIDGLAGNDLPRFTTAAGTLAKATKANVTDITSYFGTMYGIFRNQANEMGKAAWVEQLAGQTATAVQMFKTTGPEMSAAFTSIGAEAQTMGVKLNEQIAILGSLQSTMSGSEAGTKYRAFLTGIAGAQEKLGLNFTDESGKLLPVVDILSKIEGKFGKIDTVAKSDLLKNAFGTSEATAFIKLMSTDIGKLNGDIQKLAKTEGMEKAVWMAEQMNDPWARLASGVKAVTIAIWQKALPSIEPYIAMLIALTNTLVDWADKYPHLTKYIGLGVTAMMLMVAVGGSLTLMLGLLRFSFVGAIAISKLWTLRLMVMTPLMWGWNAAVWAARTAMLAFVLYGPAMSAFFLAMKTSILTSLPAIWAFSAALFANPITWIVLGIVALIAAIVALVVYWDEVTDAVTRFSTVVFGSIGDAWAWLKQLFNDNAWLKVVFAPLYGAISVVDVLIDGFAKLPQWWSEFQIWLSGISLVPVWDLHMEAFVAIKEWWINFKAWLANLDPFAFLGESVDWMREKLSWIPGLEMDDAPTQVVKKTEETQQSINQMVALPGAEPLTQEDRGGLFQSISNLFGGSSKTTSVEKIEVHNHGTGVRGEDLAYELEMAAG
jgi:TP901 family phage tail tape measure protein